MIISPQRRFAFVHIPKTGGTSFLQAYEARAAASDILVGDTPKARQRRKRQAQLTVPGRLWKHSMLTDVGELVPADYFVVTLVRHPWDRMVSYYHWLRAQDFDHPIVKTAQSVSFAAFIRDKTVAASIRTHPAARYVTRGVGSLQCNVFARLEFPNDLQPVWEYLGFKLTIPHLNKSDRNADWRRYYNEDDIRVVAALAAEDITRFGYTADDV